MNSTDKQVMSVICRGVIRAGLGQGLCRAHQASRRGQSPCWSTHSGHQGKLSTDGQQGKADAQGKSDADGHQGEAEGDVAGPTETTAAGIAQAGHEETEAVDPSISSAADHSALPTGVFTLFRHLTHKPALQLIAWVVPQLCVDVLSSRA